MKSLYLYNDYPDVLNDMINDNGAVRGYQVKLSEAAGMHPSYLSRILKGVTHLTPDQAAGLARFWSFDPEESAYFLNLVNFERAGTDALRSIIKKDLDALRKLHENMGDRLKAQKMDDRKDDQIYYSAWFYSAVHVLLTIPEFRNPKKIAERLQITLEQTKSILTALEEMNLAKKNGALWESTNQNIFLSNDSLMSSTYHVNWRVKVAEQIPFRREGDYHYTSLHSLSADDFRKVKAILQDGIVSVDKVVRPSKEEELGCLVIDWVRL